MKLQKPFHANSQNRTQLSPINCICGDPYSWFDTEFFRNEDLYVATFDFFINWSNNSFQPIAWIKRLLYNEFSLDPQTIFKAIIKCDGIDYYHQMRLFCEKNNIELSYIIIPDIEESNWINLENKVILFNVMKYDKNHDDTAAVECLNVKELIERIHLYKVDCTTAYMGEKGLFYSTSSLESFLSKKQTAINYDKDAIYSGDVDVVIFNKDYKPLIIIEIKKHTKAYEAAPTINEDSIGLWCKKDRNKYESLDILQKHWNCEFYMLIYPTTTERVFKLEKVDNLTVTKSKILPLPCVHSQIELKLFHDQFNDFVNSKPVIANKTASGTKLYHTDLRCKYIPRDSKRITYFESISQAEDSGYNLCSTCRNS